MTVIVGAGLAGLTCAKVLSAAGRPFILCEAASQPGGRVVSQKTGEGFVLDRGFQVLLDSYPAARRHLDFAALGGGRFRSGAMFVGDGAPRVIENPLRRPDALFAAMRAGVLSLPDQLRLALLVLRSFRPAAAAGLTAAELLRSSGFSEEFFVRFARPFFGGVLLDPALGTNARLLLGYLRNFLTGSACLPGDGIGAVARQLADGLPAGRIRYSCPVAALRFRGDRVAGVALRGDEMIEAQHVVLAADEPSARRLLGQGPARKALGTAVHYFRCERPFYRGAWLCLPPRREGSPVLHAAQVTNVAPSLAPAGAHLWSVTVLPEHFRAADADFVARDVASWFGAEPGELRHLALIEVPYAVPRQDPCSREVRASPDGPDNGVILAGDAFCAASIDAVMASGEAAAKKVISSAVGN